MIVQRPDLSGHSLNLASIGIRSSALSGLEFKQAADFARTLYAAQLLEVLNNPSEQSRAAAMNEAYQEFADDSASAGRLWPYAQPLEAQISRTWREVNKGLELHNTLKSNIAEYLSDLVASHPDSVFSGKPLSLRLFDLNRAGGHDLGGRSKVYIAEDNRADLLENWRSDDPETRERVHLLRSILSRIYREFKKEIAIDSSGTVFTSGRPVGTVVGIAVVPDLEKFCESANLVTHKLNSTGSTFDSLQLERLSPAKFTHFTPWLSARIPLLNKFSAALLISYRPHHDSPDGGSFAVEGQLISPRNGGASDEF